MNSFELLLSNLWSIYFCFSGFFKFFLQAIVKKKMISEFKNKYESSFLFTIRF